jgi:8-oxo-dGTP diphosphatase
VSPRGDVGQAPGSGDDLGPDVVRAAGGVVVRPGIDGVGVEVLIAHRPRYDDWTIPKGKLDPGETWEQAALREVAEETGYRCRLGEPVAEVHYRDHKGRPKVVRYWSMTVDGGDFEANDEVDEVRWLAPADAASLLTYEHDRPLVERLRSA